MKSADSATQFTVGRLVSAYSAPKDGFRFKVILNGCEWLSAPTYEAALAVSRGFKGIEIVEEKAR